jgi:hypothetical protein
VQRALGAEMAAGRRALAAFSRHPRLVHEVLRSLPNIALGRTACQDAQHDDRQRYPMWDLFVRLVSGETSLAQQLERRRVRLLVRALGG